MNHSSTGPLPLASVRVLDLTHYAAGPLVTQMLADYGAEVIKIESEGYTLSGGGGRWNRPQGSNSLNTGYFHNKFGTSSSSITVDLVRPEGVAVFLDLVRISDVVVDNMRPHVMPKWGLGYDAISAVNPHIIMMQMPTMGEGPRGFYAGLSWGIQAQAGLNAISGYPDRAPISPSPYSHPDTTSNPFHAMVALSAALLHRRKTGQGQYIEVSQYESTINFMETLVLEQTANGRNMEPKANRDPRYAPQGVYRCEGDDRWCAVSVETEQEWLALCTAIERPDLTTDPRFNSFLGRQQHAGELDGVIEAWTSQHTSEEVMQRLQQAGVAAGQLQDAEDLLHKDPQLAERGHWIYVDHPELGNFVTDGWGFHLSGAPPKPRRHAPLLGEDNDRIFGQLLGMAEETVNDFIVSGVIR